MEREREREREREGRISVRNDISEFKEMKRHGQQLHTHLQRRHQGAIFWRPLGRSRRGPSSVVLVSKSQYLNMEINKKRK